MKKNELKIRNQNKSYKNNNNWSRIEQNRSLNYDKHGNNYFIHGEMNEMTYLTQLKNNVHQENE